jgi:hypothetical protein
LGLDWGRGSDQGKAVSLVESGGHCVEGAGGEIVALPEQEGEPSCLLALEAEEKCCRQRRARARYAGDQRPDLRDPDDQAIEKPHSLERSLMPRDQLGKAEQQRHDHGGVFEAADRGGAGVEQLGEGKPGNADQYRADRDPEGELERAVGEVAPADGRQRAEQEVAHVKPK